MRALVRTWALAGVALLLGAAACTGSIRGGTNGTTGENGALVGPDGGVVCFSSKNDEVRQRLAGACVSCHGKGSTKPFFAELSGFQDLLVYNPTYVVAGHPDDSLFIKLLEGHGTGTFTQMPLSQTYQAALDEKKTLISLAELRDWVTNLPPKPGDLENPDPDAITVRRVTAEEIRQSMMDQLGLVPTDFGREAPEGWYMDGHQLGLLPPNEAPGFAYFYANDYGAGARFEALGGPNIMQYRLRSKIWSPSALQTLVQTSQAWCSIAVKKTGNKAILNTVTLQDKSATASDKIKANIRTLYRRMLGEVPTDADVQAVFDEVYAKYEPQGTDIAWTAVCAGFVRDPLWVMF